MTGDVGKFEFKFQDKSYKFEEGKKIHGKRELKKAFGSVWDKIDKNKDNTLDADEMSILKKINSIFKGNTNKYQLQQLENEFLSSGEQDFENFLKEYEKKNTPKLKATKQEIKTPTSTEIKPVRDLEELERNRAAFVAQKEEKERLAKLEELKKLYTEEYIIKSGDTLGKLALAQLKAEGIKKPTKEQLFERLEEIMLMNPDITDMNAIRVGQKVLLRKLEQELGTKPESPATGTGSTSTADPINKNNNSNRTGSNNAAGETGSTRGTGNTARNGSTSSTGGVGATSGARATNNQPEDLPIFNNNDEVITGNPLFAEAGITKVVKHTDPDTGETSDYIFYNDGRIIKEFYQEREVSVPIKVTVAGKTAIVGHKKETKDIKFRRVVQSAPKSEEITPAKLSTAVPIEIKLPTDAPEKAVEMAKSLENNKAELMKVLGIDNDTYNKFAIATLAIAEQESEFGKIKATFSGAESLIEKADSLMRAEGKAGDYSYGLTQIKFQEVMDNPTLKKQFFKFGIKKASDLYDPEKAAIATVIMINNKHKVIQTENWQKGMEASKGAITEVEGYEMVNGKLVKTENTKPYVVGDISELDAIVYAYNGNLNLVRGTADPLANEYARSVREFVQKYEIIEDPAERTKAFANEPVLENERRYKSGKSLALNGPLGSVVFDGKKAKNKDIKILTEVLANNPSISDESKELLINAVKAGKVSFKFGLKEKEAKSLRQQDVDLLLKYAAIGGDGANRDFKEEYLKSWAVVVNANDVDASSITTLNDVAKTRSKWTGNLKDTGVRLQNGTTVKYDRNTNKWSTSDFSKLTPSEVLALYAQRTALEKASGGECFTYNRKSMIEAGINAANSSSMAQRAGLEDKGSAYYLNFSKARDAVEWYTKNPNMWEEVKYTDVGGGQVRELTYADIVDLPAGYQVLFIPGDGYGSEPGHIFTTSGTGLGYSDETDNIAWADMANGKGNHGTFRVFRLTENWVVNPQTQQLEYLDPHSSQRGPVISNPATNPPQYGDFSFPYWNP